MPLVYGDFDQAALDAAYDNSAHVGPEKRAAYVGGWAARSDELRARVPHQADLAYGDGLREVLDFVPCGRPGAPTFAFFHGGYWQALDRAAVSHCAAGLLARGVAVACPSYDLCPSVPLATIAAQAEAAARALHARLGRPMVASGHSAGGHLAARMGCADQAVPRLRRVVPISPLAELAPLMETEMQDKLVLDAAECAAESPALLARAAGVEAHVWVGGQERPAFLWQARVLSEEWGCPWTVDAGRHHFDVVEGLAEAGSGLVEACLGGLG